MGSSGPTTRTPAALARDKPLGPAWPRCTAPPQGDGHCLDAVAASSTSSRGGRGVRGGVRRSWAATRAKETHVRGILRKLDIPDQPDGHSRILAVLTYLRSLDHQI